MAPYGIGTCELLVAKLGLVLSVCLPSTWATVSEGCHLVHFVSMRNAPEEGNSRNTGLFMPEHCFCQALALDLYLFLNITSTVSVVPTSLE